MTVLAWWLYHTLPDEVSPEKMQEVLNEFAETPQEEVFQILSKYCEFGSQFPTLESAQQVWI